MAFPRKLLGLLRLFRFELPFTAGICVVLGELLALGKFPPVQEVILGFLSVFFISATSLILNDYFDLEIDKINAPERPLPAGLVSKRDVIFLSIAVTFLGFIAAAAINLTALIVAILVWAIGFLYNWRYKRAGLLGNLLVCFSVGMTFVFGGIAVGKPFESPVWFFAILVLMIDLGEEIAADAMDAEGDREAGSKSLALLLGSENALKISAGIFSLVIAYSCLPFIFGWMEWIYALPLTLMDIVILYSTGKLLDVKIPNQRNTIRAIYLSGLAALIIFLVIRLLK